MKFKNDLHTITVELSEVNAKKYKITIQPVGSLMVFGVVAAKEDLVEELIALQQHEAKTIPHVSNLLVSLNTILDQFEGNEDSVKLKETKQASESIEDRIRDTYGDEQTNQMRDMMMRLLTGQLPSLNTLKEEPTKRSSERGGIFIS